jgi:hypothetical protein
MNHIKIVASGWLIYLNSETTSPLHTFTGLVDFSQLIAIPLPMQQHIHTEKIQKHIRIPNQIYTYNLSVWVVKDSTVVPWSPRLNGERVVHITQEFESGPLRGNSVCVTLMTKYKRKTATMKDHVLTAGELKTSWLYPTSLRVQIATGPPPPFLRGIRPWPDHLGRQDYSWPKIVQTTQGPRLPRSGLLMDHHTCLRTCETSDLQWL